jgi:hypothetical protein
MSRKHSAETRAKMSASHRGKTLSAEHRAAIAAAKRGKPQPPEHRAAFAAAMRGKTKSAAHREAMSQAHVGKKFTDDHRSNMREAMKLAWAEGRKQSDQGQKDKIAAGQRSYHARRRLKKVVGNELKEALVSASRLLRLAGATT